MDAAAEEKDSEEDSKEDIEEDSEEDSEENSEENFEEDSGGTELLLEDSQTLLHSVCTIPV